MKWNGLELPDKDIYFQDEDVIIYYADCRDILPSLCGVSAVVTDPPYELGFMGKKWDGTGIAFQIDTWRLIMEACLPGAMLFSFGGTRTSHRLACAIEDAGWEIRDTIMFVYGSGFPKSHNLSGAIDKKLGYGDRGHRIAVANRHHPDGTLEPNGELLLPYEAKSPEAKLWEGYGTALKPAYEPIILAMKPLDGTFANNALKHKVAGLNIDATRIPMAQQDIKTNTTKASKQFVGVKPFGGSDDKGSALLPNSQGRFPADFIHDGSQEVMELFPEAGNRWKRNYGEDNYKGRQYKGGSFGGGGYLGNSTYSDSGSAARFFYCAKASRKERDAGLEDMPTIRIEGRDIGQDERNVPYKNRPAPQRNQHPTVKPLALMSYLCKLVKMPEYNLILDPFCGSGSTLLACKKLGIKAIGIDSNEEYCEIASKRCMRVETAPMRLDE